MTLLAALEPRDDVLTGELTESRFAAGLEDVIAGRAADAYGKPSEFFARTYPSEGLRTLLNEALGRLRGTRPDAASILRLETAFGGGKTHNLIALYHAARGGLPDADAPSFLDPAVLEGDGGEPAIAAFVGTTAGASTFPEVAGVSASTPWGYLALQIAGKAGYEVVRQDDEALSAPGSDQLKRVFGDRPVLILVDEIARYLSAAGARKVADSTLAKQTLSFLMSLLEAADSSERVVVVITTAGETDAFASDTEALSSVLREVSSLLARKELVLRASGEADLPKILARRLFKTDIERMPERSLVASRYAEIADSAHSAGLDLPTDMLGAAFAKAVETTFPFHPDLIEVLDKRLSTIPNFQRTRGALRLLARAVRRIWDGGQDLDLIHLHHIDLSDPVLAEELSSRIDRPLYEPVIRADIAQQVGGTPSHADDVDARMGTRYGRRLATAAYLFSLTRDVPGVPASALHGAVLAPGDDPNLITKALDSLENTCWYLHSDVRGYRFSTEASLVRLIQEAEEKVSGQKVRERATKILSEQYKDSALKVRRAWEDARVPDNSEDAYLVVYHWDDFDDAKGKKGFDPADGVPGKVTETYEKSPVGGVREFRNRIVFLVPNAQFHEPMLAAVRRLMALEQLKTTPELLASLGETKRAEVARQSSEALGLARVAVCNHVSVLYVPDKTGLESTILTTVTSASLLPNQTDAIISSLDSMDKLLREGSKPLDPAWVRTRLGVQFESPQPTMELARAFARRPDLKLVLDRQQLVNLLLAGVRNGVWEYQAPDGGAVGWSTKTRPGPTPRLSEDALMHPPGSAPELGTEACPLCGKVHEGLCDDGGGGSSDIDEDSKAREFAAAGSAGPSLISARQAAVDAGRKLATRLRVSVITVGDDAGKELQRLLTVPVGAGSKAKTIYRIDARVQLDDPAHVVHVDFTGTPVDYAVLREPIRALLSRQASVTASVDTTWTDPVELQGPEIAAITNAAQSTGPTKCDIRLITEGDA